MLVQVDQLSKTYGERTVLDRISFTVQRGECLGILGPNGSGKSTLLKLLSGFEKADGGKIMLNGKPIAQHSRKDLAKWLAVLQQESLPPLGFTVKEVVEMGRFPFQNWLGEEKMDHEPLINSILMKLDLYHLRDRTLEHLSGGERQRVSLGKTMAQQPKLLMLDEPTTYLDIGHQVHLLNRVREWQKEEEMTVISVMHDLNLAALYCDRLMMLHEGRIVGIGSPAELFTSELIFEVYGITPVIIEHPLYKLPQIFLSPDMDARRSDRSLMQQNAETREMIAGRY